MQYILIDKEQVTDGRYHETLPDGRVVLPITDARTLGNLSGVDIIGSARELKELVARQKEAGVTPPKQEPDPTEPETGVEEVDPGMQVTPEPETEPETGEPETEVTEEKEGGE